MHQMNGEMFMGMVMVVRYRESQSWKELYPHIDAIHINCILSDISAEQPDTVPSVRYIDEPEDSQHLISCGAGNREGT